MDLYLVEGPKIFYRLALSAIKLYHSSTMLDADRTGIKESINFTLELHVVEWKLLIYSYLICTS